MSISDNDTAWRVKLIRIGRTQSVMIKVAA